MKQKLAYMAYFSVCRAFSLLCLPVLYVISDAIYLLLYRIGRYRIRVVRENLATSFPDKSAGELRAIEKAFYHQLCDTIVESIKLLDITPEQLLARGHVKVNNASIVEEIAAEKRPIMLFLAHMGNWEWVPTIQLCYSRPTVSAEIYKPQRDEAFDRLMKTVRARYASYPIPQRSAYRDILQLHRDNETFIVGFVADHRSNHAQAQQRVEFLNHTTPVDVGAEKIGSKVNARYLYLDIAKTGRGRYELTFKRIEPDNSGDPYPYTTAYYKMLEQNILRQPHLWLWSHRRWLFK